MNSVGARMSNSREFTMGSTKSEISAMLKQVGEDVIDQYYFDFCEAIAQVEPHRAPLETWLGLAHAFADACGYQIVLQAAILETVEGEPKTFRMNGWKDVARVEPNLFFETSPAATNE